MSWVKLLQAVLHHINRPQPERYTEEYRSLQRARYGYADGYPAPEKRQA